MGTRVKEGGASAPPFTIGQSVTWHRRRKSRLRRVQFCTVQVVNFTPVGNVYILWRGCVHIVKPESLAG